MPQLIEFGGDAPGVRRHEPDAAPPRPMTIEIFSIEPSALAAIAHDDVALGDLDDLGVKPMDAAPVDPDCPYLHGHVGRVEVEPTFKCCRLPVVGLHLEPARAILHAPDANPNADAPVELPQPLLLGPERIAPQPLLVLVVPILMIHLFLVVRPL